MAKSTGTTPSTGTTARVRNLITGAAVSVTETARRAAEKLASASKAKTAPKAVARAETRKSAPEKAEAPVSAAPAAKTPARTAAKATAKKATAKASAKPHAASAERAGPSGRTAAAPKGPTRTGASKAK